MDQRVRFPLNRSVSILIDFDEYDNPQRRRAFVLERKVIDKKGYHELRVRISKTFVDRVKNVQERQKLFDWIKHKTYAVFFNKGKTRVVVMNDGVLKFKGPLKTHTNEVRLKENTFLTMLSFIDNNFNRNDERIDEDIRLTVREGEMSDDNNESESDGDDNSDVEMPNSSDNANATSSADNISIEDVKVPELILLN